MESSTFCAFGQDCPHHGFGCGCDMRWAHETSRLDWGIEIQCDGFLKYFVFNINNDQFYMCQRHFFSIWNFNERDIYQMWRMWFNGSSEFRYRFRYEPEEYLSLYIVG